MYFQVMIFRSLGKRLAGSGRVASFGPSFGGAGIRTGALYAMWGAFAGSLFYIFVVVEGRAIVNDWKFALVKKYPWLDQKDPDEMD